MRIFTSTVVRTTAVVLLDAVFTAAAAWLMWWNAGTNVADLPGFALAVLVLVGGSIICIRQLIAARTLWGPADIRTIRSEQSAVIAHVLIASGLMIAWRASSLYLLGWFATFAAIALLVSNVLSLLADLAVRPLGTGSRRLRTAERRVNQVEWIHAGGAGLGFVGLAITARVHAWNPSILNLTTVLIAATLIAGATTSRAIRRRGISMPAVADRRRADVPDAKSRS